MARYSYSLSLLFGNADDNINVIIINTLINNKLSMKSSKMNEKRKIQWERSTNRSPPHIQH